MSASDGTFIPLDDSMLADALKPAPPKVRKSSTTVDTSIRDYSTWFKLQCRLGICENPECSDDRPKKVEEGNAMVATVSGKDMCRICFLDGYATVDASAS